MPEEEKMDRGKESFLAVYAGEQLGEEIQICKENRDAFIKISLYFFCSSADNDVKALLNDRSERDSEVDKFHII